MSDSYPDSFNGSSLDDADLLALAEAMDRDLPAATDERFEPPEGLEYPFNDDSQEQEVGVDWLPPDDCEVDLVADAYAREYLHYADEAGAPEPVFMELEGGGVSGLVFAEPEDEDDDDDDDDEDVDLAEPAEVTVESSGERRIGGANEEQLAERRPFVRSAFPAEVQPRSVVDGLSARTVVKTCFRIGEAVSIGARGSLARDSDAGDVLVELYARVSFSERCGNRQNFQFLDLFHDRPPFLSGVFEYWKRCELWDADSAAFLEPKAGGQIARIIGRMKRRDGGNGGTAFFMQIMLIWEATWEDVDFMREVVCN